MLIGHRKEFFKADFSSVRPSSERKLPKKLWFRFRGGKQENLILWIELIMQIGHRKEFLKLTLRALAFRQSELINR